MKETFNKVFSNEYIHTDVNFIQMLMYRSAYPCAVLLNKLQLRPNQITTLSLVFSLLAFVALVYSEGAAWFSIFWGLSVLFDFCDGTVARMTDRVSKPAFRYDHMSDLFKISLLFLGVGLRYDTTLVWMVSTFVLFLFMYFTLLNHELSNVLKLTAKNKQSSIANEVDSSIKPEAISETSVRIRDRFRIVAWLVKYNYLHKLFLTLWSPLTTINGHTLLLFFLLPLGPEYAVWVFSYLGFIALLGIKARIIELLSIPKP